jgi:hypothetical protein
MTPHKQRNRHRPEEGIYGDCHRTCIAMLLDLEPEEVPNFAARAPDQWVEFHGLFEDWLNARGLATLSVIFEGSVGLGAVLHHMRVINPGTFYILGGLSRSGCGHSVVGLGDQIIADPSLSDAGIVGPMEDGYYYLTFLIPLHQKANGVAPPADPEYAGLQE